MKRTRLLATAATAACVTVVSGAASSGAAARLPGRRAPMDPNAAVIHWSNESWSAVKAFWTPQRMRSARPLEIPATTSASGQVAPQAATAGISAPPSLPRAARLRKRSAIWTAHNEMPASTVGKLYFMTPDGAADCTGTVITAPNESTVWTAGHCLSDGKGHWYKDFEFVPDLHGNITPYGTYEAKAWSTPKGFFHKDAIEYDLGALAMHRLNGQSLQDNTGSQGFRFGRRRSWRNVYIFGYPSTLAPPVTKVDGTQLRYCISNTKGVSVQHTDMIGFFCNMLYGASGGPLIWDLKLSSGGGYVVGDFSRGKEGTYDRISPIPGRAAVNVYNGIKNK